MVEPVAQVVMLASGWDERAVALAVDWDAPGGSRAVPGVLSAPKASTVLDLLYPSLEASSETRCRLCPRKHYLVPWPLGSPFPIRHRAVGWRAQAGSGRTPCDKDWRMPAAARVDLPQDLRRMVSGLAFQADIPEDSMEDSNRPVDRKRVADRIREDSRAGKNRRIHHRISRRRT